METIKVLTPDNIELEYTLASVGVRILASVIDLLIQLAGYAFLVLGAWLVYGSDLFTTELDSWLIAIGLVVFFAIQYGYSVFFDLAMRGQTPGKRMFGLRVIRSNGQAITPVHAVVREFMKMTVDMLGPGVVFMLFNRHKKRIGDLAASTLVVEEERIVLSVPHLSDEPGWVRIQTERLYLENHKAEWDDLEARVRTLSRSGASGLSPRELKQFLHLIRQTSHHLAYVRTHFPGGDLADYLNSLSGRAHNQLYVVRRFSLRSIGRYLFKTFPALLAEYRLYILAAFVIFFVGGIISYVMVRMDNGTARYFLPENIASRTDWRNREVTVDRESFPVMSSYITINNIGVSIKAFTFGISAGIGTLWILLSNGAMLGGLTALVANHGETAPQYWSLILPHGILELSAIFISGGAGLSLGRSLLLPGEYTRTHALARSAGKSAALIPGIALLLILAGAIEGFFTPLPIESSYKLWFALMTFVLLVVYFSLPYWRKGVLSDGA